MLFDLLTDPSERFSFMREQPGVAAHLLAQVNKLREEIEPMRKEAYNPFKPSNPDAPIGPQLTSDVAVGAN
jgi:hypothetical protein